jgi:hypothetical protein
MYDFQVAGIGAPVNQSCPVQIAPRGELGSRQRAEYDKRSFICRKQSGRKFGQLSHPLATGRFCRGNVRPAARLIPSQTIYAA